MPNIGERTVHKKSR